MLPRRGRHAPDGVAAAAGAAGDLAGGGQCSVLPFAHSRAEVGRMLEARRAGDLRAIGLAMITPLQPTPQ